MLEVDCTRCTFGKVTTLTMVRVPCHMMDNPWHARGCVWCQGAGVVIEYIKTVQLCPDCLGSGKKRI